MKQNYNHLVSENVDKPSLSQIPRNFRQLINHKSIHQEAERTYFHTKDDYYDAIKNIGAGDFVGNISFESTSVSSVCFTRQQFNDLIRFCAIGDSVVNIDTTFELGDYYVTPITFRNLSVINPATNQHPLYLGPVMMHTKKDYSSYLYFAHILETYFETHRNEFSESIRKVKRVITDDDPSIRKAFKVKIN